MQNFEVESPNFLSFKGHRTPIMILKGTLKGLELYQTREQEKVGHHEEECNRSGRRCSTPV